MKNTNKLIILNILGVLIFQNIYGVVHKWDSTYSAITTPPSGAGARMMWSDSTTNSFFRAGYVTNTNWHPVLIGSFSVAFGQNTRASGAYSLAMGESALATGFHSFSQGFTPSASGSHSFAFGSSTINGDHPTLASGSHSLAFGKDVRALAAHSIVFGELTKASGSYSFVSGYQSTVESGANYSFAHGYNNQTTGNSSTAIGYDNRAYGWGSVALGVLSMAKGDWSFAHGYTAVADNNSDPANPSVKSRLNVAFGWNTVSRGTSTFVVGQNNNTAVFTSNPDDPNRPLFVVGNGASPTALNNALVVYANGESVLKVPARGGISMGSFTAQ